MSLRFGDAAVDVPEPIRHAVLLMAHWYEQDPIEIGGGTAIPRPVSELVALSRGAPMTVISIGELSHRFALMAPVRTADGGGATVTVSHRRAKAEAGIAF